MERSKNGLVRAGILAGLLALVLVIPGEPTSANDPSGGLYAFADQGRGTSMVVDILPSSDQFGVFSYAVAGLGLLWPDQTAIVDFKSDHSVIVTYDGPGWLDRGAEVNSLFGIARRSGAKEATAFRLHAQINPDRITSSVELWLDETKYELVDRTPAGTPADTLEAMAARISVEDWSGVYDFAYSGFQEAVTEADLVAGMQAALAERGSIIDVRIESVPVSPSGRAGIDVATAELALDVAQGDVVTTYIAPATLIIEEGEWRFMSVGPIE